MKNKISHNFQDLIHLFNTCFAERYNTRLIKGDAEPVYLPADQNKCYNSVVFAHGFYSSALHECAHWFIAGAERRSLPDYGYWYAPDGRDVQQQKLFLSVEVKPQALEWILSTAAGFRFHFSLDNLSGETIDASEFKRRVYQQVLWYCRQGLPERANQFRKALCGFYNTSLSLQEGTFTDADKMDFIT